MKVRGRKLDPWRRRRHPNRYSVEDLHAMLLDDYVSNRPLGGPMEQGAAFLIGACARIAHHRGITTDEYFEALLAEGAALTGRSTVQLA